MISGRSSLFLSLRDDRLGLPHCRSYSSSLFLSSFSGARTHLLAFVPKSPGSKTRVCLRVPAIESLPLGRLAGLYSAAREEEVVVVVDC